MKVAYVLRSIEAHPVFSKSLDEQFMKKMIRRNVFSLCSLYRKGYARISIYFCVDFSKCAGTFHGGSM